jgi:DNA-binding transcriptional LysR family regulator
MSIRRLKTLIAIAEKGTFAAAADVVHISQAAVSQQMKGLEDELQIRLFDRSKRPPELSQLGLALTARSREIVHAYDAMLKSLTGDSPFSGKLMIGAALSRENSRGAHYREDFPDQGELESSYFTVARQGENGTLDVSREAVVFSIVKPGETLLEEAHETLPAAE